MEMILLVLASFAIIGLISAINLPPTESSGYDFGVNACLQKLKFSHLTKKTS